MSSIETHTNTHTNEMANNRVDVDARGLLDDLRTGGSWNEKSSMSEMIDNALDQDRVNKIRIWALKKYFGFANDGTGMSLAKLKYIQRMCQHKAARAGISGRFGIGYPAAREMFMGGEGRCEWMSLQEATDASTVDELVNKTSDEGLCDDKNKKALNKITIKMDEEGLPIREPEELSSRAKEIYKYASVSPLEPNTVVSFEMGPEFNRYIENQATNTSFSPDNAKHYLLKTYHNHLKAGKQITFLGAPLVPIPSLEEFVTTQPQVCECVVGAKFDGVAVTQKYQINRTKNVITHRLHILSPDTFEMLKSDYEIEGYGKKNKKFDENSRTLPLMVEEIGTDTRNPIFMLAIQEKYEPTVYGEGVYKQKIVGMCKKELKKLIKFHTKAVIGHKAVGTMAVDEYLKFITPALEANGFDIPTTCPKFVFTNVLKRALKFIEVHNQDRQNDFGRTGTIGFINVQNEYSIEGSDRPFNEDFPEADYYNCLDKIFKILMDKSFIDYNNIDNDVRTAFRFLQHKENPITFTKDYKELEKELKKTIKTILALKEQGLIEEYSNDDNDLQVEEAIIAGICRNGVVEENIKIIDITGENITCEDEEGNEMELKYEELMVGAAEWQAKMLQDEREREAQRRALAGVAENIQLQIRETEGSDNGGNNNSDDDAGNDDTGDNDAGNDDAGDDDAGDDDAGDDDSGDDENNDDDYDEEAAQSPSLSHHRAGTVVGNGHTWNVTKSKVYDLEKVTDNEARQVIGVVLKQISNEFFISKVDSNYRQQLLRTLNRGTRTFEECCEDMKSYLEASRFQSGELAKPQVLGSVKVGDLWDRYIRDVNEA